MMRTNWLGGLYCVPNSARQSEQAHGKSVVSRVRACSLCSFFGRKIIKEEKKKCLRREKNQFFLLQLLRG